VKFLEMSAKHAGRILAELGKGSAASFIIKNGLIIESWPGVEIIRILCNDSDAEIVIEAARAVCPDAIPELEQSIRIFPYREL
jgi:hypothetical protein